MRDAERDRILLNIDRQETVALECGLVEIPSFTTEEAEIAKFIHGQMRSFDLEASLQEVPLESGNVSYNVIGRLRGSGQGPTLLLFGHMDTSPILGRQFASLDTWKREPFKPSIEGEWLYGYGCHDEKGGLCSMVTAAKALVRSGFKPKGDVYFVAVQGHKRISSGTLHLLRSGFRADYAVNTENSGNAVVPTWVGRAEGKLHIREPEEPELHFHSKEQIPELRNRKSAFEHLQQLLRALGPEMAPPGPNTWMTFAVTPGLEGYPQIRIEMIHFHRLTHLELSFQVRIVPGQTDDTIRADLERLIRREQQVDPHFRVDVEWPSWLTRPAGHTPSSNPLVQTFARWHEFVAGEPPDVGTGGRLGAAADASHIVGHLNIPTILYGPGGGMTDLENDRRVVLGEVEPDERVRIDDIVTAAKVYALSAADLCG